ncbi:NADH-quinone oxidoreductase subunit M [Enterobacteriaceae endosymbiont of Plateumaris consimilis]|uniref:NADH-quinone oxidoreductase subunit M n=1 Tax=Enterobacteriaceae endosymbiont of Plateumaris consimilis TaxID=2675794 RepID=UPI001449D974|nr:NADH-quinone oxidoreductase subunit M [Enterobacteriaceae endosymbiont of Plateumaris consimilis]QJC28765.1 NADH-quinone oxidoreductase subunit M [Enterobacteriaceae endosymbiont of Plateumaris consimilis]
MLLPWFILIPFIGGLICWQSERLNYKLPRWISLLSISMVFFLSIIELFIHSYSLNNKLFLSYPIWISEFILPWIPRFGINFHLATDGLSIIMINLTGLLGIMAVLCSWNETKKLHGFFHLNLLWILSGVIGVFLAIDMFLFFLCWEIMLIPMYFLISLWGHNNVKGKNRIVAATKFFIYTQAGGLLMLIGILTLVFLNQEITGVWTFEYSSLLYTPKSFSLEFLLMLCFFIAFAVKIPVIPLHGWLPDAHSQAPTAGSVDLAGILLKTAAYGLLRFSLPLFPLASLKFAPIAIILGIIGIFYGSWLAFIQNDIKRIIAYTSISHMGFVLIGIYSNNKIAYQGVIIQMISHGISAAAQFIICGQIYERLKTRNINLMGGFWSNINWLPGFFLFFALASLGIPGTGNFIGEFLILIGNFQFYPIYASIATFGLIFASIYSLNMMQKIFYGPIKKAFVFKKMVYREIFIITSLLVILLILGFYPQPILNISYNVINNIYNKTILN